MITNCRICKAQIKAEDPQAICDDCANLLFQYITPIVEKIARDIIQSNNSSPELLATAEKQLREILVQAETKLELVLKSHMPQNITVDLSGIKDSIVNMKKELDELRKYAELQNKLSKDINAETVKSTQKLIDETRAKINGIGGIVLEATNNVEKLSGCFQGLEGKVHYPRVGLGRGIL